VEQSANVNHTGVRTLYPNAHMLINWC